MLSLDGFTRVGPVLGAGVYVLVWRGRVEYVGKSTALLARIYAHRNMWKRRGERRLTGRAGAKGILFDEVWVMPVPESDLDRLEREMIARYRPRLNQLLVPKVASLPAAVIASIGLATISRRPAREPERIGIARRA